MRNCVLAGLSEIDCLQIAQLAALTIVQALEQCLYCKRSRQDDYKPRLKH